MKSDLVTAIATHIVSWASFQRTRWCGCTFALGLLLALAAAAVSTAMQGQTLTVLHTFLGADGNSPSAGLFRDSAGNLYGSTFYGGTFGFGTVFKLDSSGNETVLYSFAGGTDGANPFGGVIRDSAGNLYGTTSAGGSSTCQCGTVFKLDSTGKETVLYRFRGGTDGATPYAGVIRDSAGNLYGVTSAGGHLNGTVFKVDATGKESVLYRFRGDQNTGPDGSMPIGGVIRDSTGNLYGTTLYGGFGLGVLFKVDATGKESVLHSFIDADGGINPKSNLIFCGPGLCGTIDDAAFKVNRKSGNLTVIYAFTGIEDGIQPWGGVIQDAAGNYYGTTSGGGFWDFGTLFKVDATGRKSTLYAFMGDADGGYPQGSLVRDSAGNLYGIAPFGGDHNCQCGTVYKLAP